VRAASAFQGKLLATRYAPDVDALIESATRAGDALAGDTRVAAILGDCSQGQGTWASRPCSPTAHT